MFRSLFLPLLFTLIAGTAAAQYPRTVLLEVSESTLEGESETAICEKKALKELYADSGLVVISHHWQNQAPDAVDPLYTDFSEEWASRFLFTNWSSGSIDRISTDGVGASIPAADWSDSIAARVNRPAEALVSIPEVLLDPDYNEIFIRINARWGVTNSNYRDLRFFCYLVEDGVEADQHLDTNINGICEPFKSPLDTFETIIEAGDTSYIVGRAAFKHNDVPILCLSGPKGTMGEGDYISSQVVAGYSFNREFTLPKPAGYDVDDLRVVAFVAEYSDEELMRNAVINAAKNEVFLFYNKDDTSHANHPGNPENPNSKYYQPTAVAELNSTEAPAISISPNPMKDFGSICFTLPTASEVSVSVYDLNGILVMSVLDEKRSGGEHRLLLSTSSLESGSYVVRVQSDRFVASKQFVIIR